MKAESCPSIAELLVPDEELTPEVRGHLGACRRCRALRRNSTPKSMETLRQEAVEAWTKPLTRRPALSQEPTLGAVFTVRASKWDDFLVGILVSWSSDDAEIVPVSTSVVNATEWDLILERTLLGYQAIAEVWNRGTVLIEQLEERLTQLDEPARRSLSTLYEAARNDTVRPSTETPVGVAILGENDPRRLFQADEIERTATYWELAGLLASVSTVGELVRTRREALELEPEFLSDVFAPADLYAVETDRLSIPTEIVPADFARLMKVIGIEMSRRLRALLQASAIATYRDPVEGSIGPAFYRTRQVGGTWQKRTPRDRAVEKWIDAVTEQMTR